MSIFDAKKRMYDEMEEFAGNEAAKRSSALADFKGKGVPIAQESVTVVAQPKAGAKLSPEELRAKVQKMGVLPEGDRFTKDLEANREAEDEKLRRALEDAMRASR